MNHYKFLIVLLVAVLSAANTTAADAAKSAANNSTTQSSEALAAFKERMMQAFPQFGVQDVSSTSVSNVYQVELKTGELLYLTSDGRHIFSGDLMRIENTGIVNVSEEWRSERRIEGLKGLEDKDLVVYPAKGSPKGEVIVFTDVSCGYCRKFHSEIPQLNAQGITVKYAAWPRYGLNSAAGKTMVNIWCAKDRETAMDEAKHSKEVAAPAGKVCDQQVVEDQITLGQTLGIRGTPAVFSMDGKQLGGYVPANKLVEQLVAK